MIGYFQDRTRRANAIGIALIALCALVAGFASVSLSGTKTGALLSLGATFGPALLYAAIVAPIAFPFSAYVVLTPFNSILSLPAFGTLTYLLGAATGLALLFYMIRCKRFAEPPSSVVVWIVFMLWMAASMFWAIDPQTSEQLYPTAIELFGLYLVVSMFRITLKDLRLVTLCAAGGGILAAAYGVYLYHTGVGVFKDRLWIHVDNASWNPDHFATSLILPIALCLVAVLWSRSLWTRLLSLGGLGVMLTAVVLSGTRGAVVGLVALVIYLIFRDPHRRGLIAVSVLTTGVALAVAGPGYFARWALAQQNGGAGRMAIWHVGLLAFKQNWLFGAGYANFPFAYDRAFIHVYESFYAQWHRASHNIILGTAVELGIIGLILLIAGWVAQFRTLRFIAPADPRYPLRLALEGTLIALFIAGIFLDIMIEKYVWLAFMLVALTYNTAVPAPARTPAVETPTNA